MGIHGVVSRGSDRTDHELNWNQGMASACLFVATILMGLFLLQISKGDYSLVTGIVLFGSATAFGHALRYVIRISIILKRSS